MMAPAMAYSLGVDVGTTFTAAAIVARWRVEVVALGAHRVTVPTVVFADGDDVVFGSAALLRAAPQPAGRGAGVQAPAGRLRSR